MPYGLPWSEEFVQQLDDKALRDEFVADQTRARIALLVRALREQEDRQWTQTELGERAGKKQNVISRIEDPDYGKHSLQTLLEVAAAFDLPLWFDIPEWDEWLKLIGNVPNKQTRRTSFNSCGLIERARAAKHGVSTGSIGDVAGVRARNATTGSPQMVTDPQTGIELKRAATFA
jgi:transcriptional regulator with XRE-family HTH domain